MGHWARWSSADGNRVLALPLLVVAGLVLACAALLAPNASAQTFGFTGSQQTFVVPAGTDVVGVALTGGDGEGAGSARGGHGGVVTANLAVSPGDTLYVEVGSSGVGEDVTRSNGGGVGGDDGPSNAAMGGGASDIRSVGCPTSSTSLGCPTDVTSLESRLIVAGGGGGQGIVTTGQANSDGDGGDAQAPGSDNLGIVGFTASGGTPGTQAEGGSGGQGCSGAAGDNGTLGVGGHGGGDQGDMGNEGSGGGGGGGGYWGGGGGGACFGGTAVFAGGGGGGSDFAGPSTTDVSTGIDSTLGQNGSVTIAPTPPSIVSPPSLSGADRIGTPLTVVHGGWTNTPTSFTYVWWRCDAAGANCVAIPGAVAATYSLAPQDQGSTIRVQETATNAFGTSDPSTSTASGVVGDVPQASTSPGISGPAVAGYVLRESHANWTNSPTGFAYQWLRCSGASTCAPILGAVGPTYQLGAGDIGSAVRVQEVASNAYGAGPPTLSTATQVVASHPIETAAISGPIHIRVGEPVTYQPGVIDTQGSPRAYRWSVDGTRVGTHLNLSYTFTTPGRHVVVLQVTDTAGDRINAKLVINAELQLLKIDMDFDYNASASWTEFTTLIAHAVPIGTRIVIGCAGTGCPFDRHTLAVTAHSSCRGKTCRGRRRRAPAQRDVELTGLVRGHKLDVGSRLTVEFSLRFYVGELEKFVITTNGPRRQTACSLTPGSKAVRGC